MYMLPLMSSAMAASSLMCFFSNSWVSLWVLLELNTLSFCMIMKSFLKSKETELSLKYFLIQSISSALLMMSSIMNLKSMNFFYILMVLSLISLLIKMASSPFHQWFTQIVKKASWKSGAILMTWQKIAPVFLLIYQPKNLIMPFMILCALMGSTLQMNKNNVKEILGFSSIFNLSWMLLAISLSFKVLLIYSMMYWSTVIFSVMFFKKSKIFKINSELVTQMKMSSSLFILASLGGVPPLMGFLAKLLVFSESILIKIFFVSTIILTLSSINLFIYLRIINKSITESSIWKQKFNISKKLNFLYVFIFLNLFPLMIICI